MGDIVASAGQVRYCEHMVELTIDNYPLATPVTNTGVEMATGSLKIVVAQEGSFEIEGEERTAFIVGSRLTPVSVTYCSNPSCYECSIPPWMIRALLDVSAAELVGSVFNLSDLPMSPFRRSVQSEGTDQLSVARAALADWGTGRGTADARLTSAVWSRLWLNPSLRIVDIAACLNIGARRVRRALRQETGLSSADIRRLVRHKKAIAELSDWRKTLAQAAYDAGYADQSHMNREMIALGAITPLAFRNSITSIEGNSR